MAEGLGSVLLQPLCAVVPVPRQEDWGIFDAVATILQSQGDYLFAEQSFLVQFKSPRAKPMRYTGKRLEALLKRELAFLVGRVDIHKGEIELFDAGGSLAHPNASEVETIELRLGTGNPSLKAGELVAYLSKPILRWQFSDMLDADFRGNAYEVLSQWLALDSERRAYFRLGIIEFVSWETNCQPTKTGGFQMFRNRHNNQLPKELAPAIRLITALAADSPELIQSAGTLLEWARDRNVDPDPGGIVFGMTHFSAACHRASKAREQYPAAEIALALILNDARQDWLDFWLLQELGGSKRQSGSVSELRKAGFEIEVDPDTNIPKTLSLGPEWLQHRKFELIGEMDNVFLLKRH